MPQSGSQDVGGRMELGSGKRVTNTINGRQVKLCYRNFVREQVGWKDYSAPFSPAAPATQRAADGMLDAPKLIKTDWMFLLHVVTLL